jgi:hypothetical protein
MVGIIKIKKLLLAGRNQVNTEDPHRITTTVIQKRNSQL